jgi:signal transduction histidine kinase
LNGVLGLTDLLMGTRLDAEQREYADSLAGSAQILVSLVTQVLDFAKIEAHRLELLPGEFDVRVAVENVVLMFMGAAKPEVVRVMPAFGE